MYVPFFCTVSVYDSSVKAPSGIELGSTYQFGSFDECMGITTNDDENVNIKPKYCLADVTLDGYSVRSEARRNFKVCLALILRFIFLSVDFDLLFKRNLVYLTMLNYVNLINEKQEEIG